MSSREWQTFLENFFQHMSSIGSLPRLFPSGKYSFVRRGSFFQGTLFWNLASGLDRLVQNLVQSRITKSIAGRLKFEKGCDVATHNLKGRPARSVVDEHSRVNFLTSFAVDAQACVKKHMPEFLIEQALKHVLLISIRFRTCFVTFV